MITMKAKRPYLFKFALEDPCARVGVAADVLECSPIMNSDENYILVNNSKTGKQLWLSKWSQRHDME